MSPMINSKIKVNLDSLKSRREWRRHKVKDGHNIFRILSPFGEASNGYPYKKWQICWGLIDPETGRARPFASSLGAEKKCPVTEYVAELIKKAEQLKTNLQLAGASEEELKENLSGINKLIADIKPKTVYIYNAVDQAGEVGLLELKSTAHKKMKTEMLQYIQDYNQDPTSLNSASDDSGVWFDVIRTGQFRDTEYDVKKHQVKVKDAATGRLSFQDNQSPLPESVVENFHTNLGYDLTAVYQIKTYEQLAEILAANLDRLNEEFPNANLNEEVLDAAPVKAATKIATASAVVKKPAAASTVKITTRLDDEDDETKVAQPKASTAVLKATQIDDDFLAEADALLNS
jgi:hypothetical protein